MAHAEDVCGNAGLLPHVAHVHLALHGAEAVIRDILELHAYLSKVQGGGAVCLLCACM